MILSALVHGLIYDVWLVHPRSSLRGPYQYSGYMAEPHRSASLTCDSGCTTMVNREDTRE